MTRNPSNPLVIIVLILLVLLASPVQAQDATAEVTPAATLEATSEATREAAPPVAVEMADGSGDLTINNNAGPAAPVTPADTSSSVPTPVVIVAAIVVGLVFLGLLYNQQQIIKIIAPLIPPESAQGLFDAALPALTSMVLNTVGAAIPGDIDDKLFIEAARQRGMIVIRGDDGLYHTTRSLAGDLANLTKMERGAVSGPSTQPGAG